MKLVNPQIKVDIFNNKPLMIHLGSGGSKHPGFYNLDLLELPDVDISADLNKPLDLIPDNSVISVYTRHTLEHIDNFIGLMAELHRICRSDAEIHIIVPHFSNPYHYSDPTHVRPFGLYTMHYFIDKDDQPGRKVPDFYKDIRFHLTYVRIDFYRTSLFDRIVVPLIRALVNFNFSTLEMYERRWVWRFPAWQIHYILRPGRKKTEINIQTGKKYVRK